MSYLQPYDYAIIAVYLLVLVGVGFYLKNRASASLEDYIVGGRKMPWWMLGFSGMASFLDVAGTVVIVSFLFMLGPRGLFVEFRGGAVLVLALMLLWTGKWHRRSGCLTGAQWMTYRFGSGLSGRFAQIVKAISVIFFTITLMTYLSKGVGIFFSTMLPFTPMQCALGLIVVAGIYTMLSGFYGVVVTDLIQSVVIIAVVGVVVFLTFDKMQGAQPIAEIAEQVTSTSRWDSAVPHKEVQLPAGYDAYKPLAWLAAIYLFRNVLFGLGTGDDPKFFGAKNDAECAKLSFLWICVMTVRWPLMIGIAILGVYMAADFFPDPQALTQAADAIKQSVPTVTKENWHDTTTALRTSPEAFNPELIAQLKDLFGSERWADKVTLLSFEGTIDPERVMPAVVLHEIPGWFRGVMLVALIAASMSTFDSSANLAAGVFVKDIYQAYLRPEASPRELIYSTWVFIAAIATIGFLFAFLIGNIDEIWSFILFGLGSGLMVPNLLRMYWWRFNGTGFAVGLAGGIIAAIATRIVKEATGFELTDGQLLLTVGGFSLACCIIGTYLSAPTDKAIVEHFYRTTRPFGLWGPLKRILPPEQQAEVTREHRRDLLALPIVLTFQILLFLTPMLMVVGNWTAAAVCGVGLVLSLGLFWFLWMRHQLGSKTTESVGQDAA